MHRDRRGLPSRITAPLPALLVPGFSFPAPVQQTETGLSRVKPVPEPRVIVMINLNMTGEGGSDVTS